MTPRDPSPTCDWIFTFLSLASCRSCISNCSCYDFMQVMAFHSCKTKFHGSLPPLSDSYSFCSLLHSFLGDLEGVICSLHATIPTCQAKYVYWCNNGLTVMGVTRGVEIWYEVFLLGIWSKTHGWGGHRHERWTCYLCFIKCTCQSAFLIFIFIPKG